MEIKWIGSPNFDDASYRKPIDRIVIHWFGVGKQAAADSQFQKTPGTSAHYSIEDNSIHQYVKEENVAYHAGVYAMNQRSIGIEHSAEPTRPATEETYKNSGALVAEICKRYNIPLDRTHIIKHSEVKATQCPGTMDLDKIINLAKGFMANTITIETTLYEKLVGNATAKKEVAEYLKIVNPDDASATEMKNTIGGIQSLVTTAQRERDEAVKDKANAEGEVSRLRDTLTESTKVQDALTRQVKSQQEMLDKQGRDIGALNGTIQTLESENRELKKGATQSLTLGDVAVLLFKKLFTIKL
jgi:N-acetylmuramoyl-L-alanine amidase CwlA